MAIGSRKEHWILIADAGVAIIAMFAKPYTVDLMVIIVGLSTVGLFLTYDAPPIDHEPKEAWDAVSDSATGGQYPIKRWEKMVTYIVVPGTNIILGGYSPNIESYGKDENARWLFLWRDRLGHEMGMTTKKSWKVREVPITDFFNFYVHPLSFGKIRKVVKDKYEGSGLAGHLMAIRKSLKMKKGDKLSGDMLSSLADVGTGDGAHNNK